MTASPANQLTRPEEADDKKHHLKGGKGFVNPWDSFTDINVAKTGFTMLW